MFLTNPKEIASDLQGHRLLFGRAEGRQPPEGFCFMKWWLCRIALLVLVNAAVPVPALAAPPPRQKPLWHTNYEQAK